MVKSCSKTLETMLLSLFRDPEVLRLVQEDRAAYFDRLGLGNKEKQALAEGSFTALASIGVHPLLRMHYLLAINPGMAAHVTIKAFLPTLEAEASHG